MNVKELITELKKCDPLSTVSIYVPFSIGDDSAVDYDGDVFDVNEHRGYVELYCTEFPTEAMRLNENNEWVKA